MNRRNASTADCVFGSSTTPVARAPSPPTTCTNERCSCSTPHAQPGTSRTPSHSWRVPSVRCDNHEPRRAGAGTALRSRSIWRIKHVIEMIVTLKADLHNQEPNPPLAARSATRSKECQIGHRRRAGRGPLPRARSGQRRPQRGDDVTMRLSARNQLSGTVTEVLPGAVTTTVKV